MNTALAFESNNANQPFVRLFNGHSPFQYTALRNASVCKRSMIVSDNKQYFMVVDQLEELHSKKKTLHASRFLLESIVCNTAPSITFSCNTIEGTGIVFVMISHHRVKDQVAYEKASLEARNLSEYDHFVTFGIQPTFLKTGPGYILVHCNEVISLQVKLDLESVPSYFANNASPSIDCFALLTDTPSLKYFWNSDMLYFKAGVFLEELKKYNLEIHPDCNAALEASILTSNNSPLSFVNEVIRISLESMQAFPEDSIGYAVMEKSDNVKVVPCGMGWSDLGSFDALFDVVRTEAENNAVLARTEYSPAPICIDSKDNQISTLDRQIALVVVQDLLIVDMPHAILSSQKGRSQKVKDVVAEIKKSKPELAETHRIADHPWRGTNYQLILWAMKSNVLLLNQMAVHLCKSISTVTNTN